MDGVVRDPVVGAVRGVWGRVSVRRARVRTRTRAASPGAVSCGGWSGEHLVGIQRSRLLAGAVGAVEEFGYAQTTVEQITTRARVSRRTFYDLFENREACLTALFEEVAATIEGEIAAADLAGLGWRERVRGGLSAMLAFFDREPALARVCVVQALRGGAEIQKRREAILTRLASLVDEGRGESARGTDCTPLTAEGLVGAAFSIVYARLLRGEQKPLVELTGELMSLIVLPYLGPAAARREQARTHQTPIASAGAAGQLPVDYHPLQEVPMRLTYRTVRVLECIAQLPGVSNRAVSERAGVADQGQISKLLARLERLGLTSNTGVGHTKGEPNAWTLTPLGRQVAQRLSMTTSNQTEAA